MILRVSWLRLLRMRLMTPASPAEHIWAARVDTLSHTRRTISQSVRDGSSSKADKML